MKVLITGATGFVGKELCKSLFNEGHDLVITGRSNTEYFKNNFRYPCEYYQWNYIHEDFPEKALADIDVIVHLMGESVAGSRWTKDKKHKIYDSRVLSSQKIVKAINESDHKPKAILAASGVGIYGNTGDQLIAEDSIHGDDFLANVCKDWESSFDLIRDQTRICHMRFGGILGNGGLQKELGKIFSKGLGGKIGSGNQWMAGIFIEDVVGGINHLIQNNNIEGAINFVTPKPFTNAQFTEYFAKKLNKPARFTVPEFALKLALGEASCLALYSQKVQPKKLLGSGYKFIKQTV